MRLDAGKNRRLAGLWVLAMAATSMLGGCAYLSHMNENAKPNAVPAMRQAQMLNPDAGRNRKAVAGLDGKVAANVQDGYAKSFQKQTTAQRATATFAGLEGLAAE
ncbi:MAG: hypothetical protein ABR538_10000 [Candidatus Binatia bacterium]